MDDKSMFIWPEDLTLQMLELRFSHDKLFRVRKQPWAEFYKILLKNGFPEEISRKRVAKKWGYLFSMYRIAKQENDKTWKYYEIFEKNFKKSKELGKYESWSNKWRANLIACVSAAKEQNLDNKAMWRSVERAMRSLDLPEDCCVSDMQGLWHYLQTLFLRSHRTVLKKGPDEQKWPLYDAMLAYYKTYRDLESLENEARITVKRSNKLKHKNEERCVDKNDNEQEFVWTKDLTESLIHIRLRNDALFNERPQAWKDFVAILKDEYGFPEQLKSRDVAKKWQSIYAEYQKSKSAKNTSWVYYNVFEAYLGEGVASIDPLFEWQEQWAIKLIETRTSLEDLFSATSKNNPCVSWREVDKKLRRDGIPLDHSLLDLENIWNYLVRTYKTKKRHAEKGVLKEQWPYFSAMAKYMEVHESIKNESLRYQSNDSVTDDMMNDDEDDIKLFDLKQQMELLESKNKEIVLAGEQCRACANVAECVGIFEENGEDIAMKLSLVAGVQVEQSDNLPSRICYNCLKELDNAYNFRRKCRMVDEQFRESKNIKIEPNKMDDDRPHEFEDNVDVVEQNGYQESMPIEKVPAKKVKKKYKRYSYYKVCEICGVHTENLKSHIDKHNTEKPYSCDVCGKKFKFKTACLVHKGTAHEANPKKTCEVCGKTFTNMSYYKKHFVKHANERKYSCESCGRRFNSLDILKVHNLIHTGERPYGCSECGKTFRTSGCVGRHKRIVHKIVKKLN